MVRTTEYIFRDNDNFRREMLLLQDLGFIQPERDPYLNFSGGPYSLIDKNLSEEVKPTPIGESVIELRGWPEAALKWDKEHGIRVRLKTGDILS